MVYVDFLWVYLCRFPNNSNWGFYSSSPPGVRNVRHNCVQLPDGTVPINSWTSIGVTHINGSLRLIVFTGDDGWDTVQLEELKQIVQTFLHHTVAQDSRVFLIYVLLSIENNVYFRYSLFLTNSLNLLLILLNIHCMCLGLGLVSEFSSICFFCREAWTASITTTIRQRNVFGLDLTLVKLNFKLFVIPIKLSSIITKNGVFICYILYFFLSEPSTSM